MVTEDDPFVSTDEIASILEALGGGGAEWIQKQDLDRDELAVEAVSDSVSTNGCDHQPHRADLFSTMKGDGADGDCAQQRYGYPHQSSKKCSHCVSGFVKRISYSVTVVIGCNHQIGSLLVLIRKTYPCVRACLGVLMVPLGFRPEHMRRGSVEVRPARYPESIIQRNSYFLYRSTL